MATMAQTATPIVERAKFVLATAGVVLGILTGLAVFLILLIPAC